MRHGKSLTLFLILAIFCSSCVGEGIEKELDEAEKMMRIHPDSSLYIISNIRSPRIKTRKTRARHSLLHSIALDKCGTDICSDSIISPAFEYYSKRGNCLEQALTYYYKARIYENAGSDESAMIWLVRAEAKGEETDDYYLCSLIHAAKGRIYYRSMDYKASAANYQTASGYNLMAGDNDRYAANLLREADCLIMTGEHEKAKDILECVREKLENLSDKRVNSFHQVVIKLAGLSSEYDLADARDDYLSSVRDPRLIEWTLIAGTYIQEGNAGKAMSALGNHTRSKDISSYQYRLAQTYGLMGYYKEAYEAFMKYDKASGKIGRGILEQDTRFIEERELRKEQYERERMKSMIMILAVCLGVAGLVIALMVITMIRKDLKLKEAENLSLRKQFEELMQEREELSRAETDNSEAKRIISERLKIIDHFVMSEALNDVFFEKKASDTLNSIIKDRKEFIRQTRLIFSASYPEFTGYLVEKGLDETEIELCCLYAIGMNGKMITSFTNVKRHYHIVSDIRKKFGLSGHDTNLSIHIRNLMQETEGIQLK